MNDRELLEMAAKAAGIVGTWTAGADFETDPPKRTEEFWLADDCGHWLRKWNPLTDDGDALRLALRLQFNLDLGYRGASVENMFGKPLAEELCHKDSGREGECTRRAITRAAAEIGKAM